MSEPNQELKGQAKGVVDRDRWQEQMFAQVGAQSASAKDDVNGAVDVLCRQLMGDQKLVGKTAAATIENLIAQIDSRLTAQINEILHNPKFQKLEGTWRGFHRLVFATESGPDLKIKFISVGKTELLEHLDEYPGAKWDQSQIFEKIYGPYDKIGGTPYGCIVGDYHFDSSVADVRLLGHMAKIASAAHAPFLAGAAPEMMGFDEGAGGWRQLEQVHAKDIAGVFESDDYAPWRDFRATEDARYVGLALPRFLARTAWGARGESVKQFAFEEFPPDQPENFSDPNRFVWANAAYPMAMNVTRAFKDCGWCSNIRGVQSGGLVTELPVYTYNQDGGIEMTCPTELSMGDRREAELAKAGFMPLEHILGTGNAVFKGAQSAQKPKAFDDDDATANAALGARLPYLFAASRFAHYLKVMVRETVGKNTSADKLKAKLQKWISKYVLAAPEVADEKDFAARPLIAAQVDVTPLPGNPGAYQAQFRIQPHYQLESVDITLSLSSTLKPGQ